MPSPSPAPHTEAAAVPDRRARLAQAVALATILITPSLYSFHFMSFGDAKLAGLAVGALLLALLVPFEEVWRRDRVILFTPLLALLVWAAAVAEAKKGFTFEGSGEGVGSGYGLILLVALLALSAASAQLLQVSIALSAVPVAILGLAQYAGFLSALFPVFPEYQQRMYSVFGNQDLLGGYLALGLVLGVALWFAGRIGSLFVGGIFVTVGPALFLSGSRSAWLAAFIGGAFAAWSSRRSPRKPVGAALVLFVVFVVSLFVAPNSTWERIAGTFAPSDVGFRIRLWIWDGTIHLIGQHPIAGVGGGNFAYHSPRALGEILHQRGPGVHVFNHIHTQHAHSDLMEIAAETGLIGVALLCVFFVLIPRRSSPAWPALATGIAFSLVNTTLHSAPHILSILLLAGSLVTPGGPTLARRPIGPIERRVYHFALGALVVGFAESVLQPSALHARAQAMLNARDGAAEKAYFRAAYLGPSYAAAYELAVLYANVGNEETALSMAERASLGLDTGDLYYLRGYLADRRRPTREAADFYRECLLRWPDHAPAYAGLLRTSESEEHERILAEARRWLSPEDFAALRSTVLPGPIPR